MRLCKYFGGSFLFLLSKLAWAISCPSGAYHVRAHHRSAYHRADGTFVAATWVRESCREKNEVYERWLSRLKSGIPPGWEIKSEKSASWSQEQRERVLEALEELPDVLRNAPVKGIYRLAKSVNFPNPASHVDDVVGLYDSAFEEKRNLARILSHEFAHSVYAHLSESQLTSYKRSLGWTEYELDKTATLVLWKERSGGYVDDDGRQGPNEDFANNMEYFIFEPDILRRTTPKAFDWMKSYLGDKLKQKKGVK